MAGILTFCRNAAQRWASESGVALPSLDGGMAFVDGSLAALTPKTDSVRRASRSRPWWSRTGA